MAIWCPGAPYWANRSLWETQCSRYAPVIIHHETYTPSCRFSRVRSPLHVVNRERTPRGSAMFSIWQRMLQSPVSLAYFIPSLLASSLFSRDWTLATEVLCGNWKCAYKQVDEIPQCTFKDVKKNCLGTAVMDWHYPTGRQHSLWDILFWTEMMDRQTDQSVLTIFFPELSKQAVLGGK